MITAIVATAIVFFVAGAALAGMVVDIKSEKWREQDRKNHRKEMNEQRDNLYEAYEKIRRDAEARSREAIANAHAYAQSVMDEANAKLRRLHEDARIPRWWR